jgi:hypothetical protein
MGTPHYNTFVGIRGVKIDGNYSMYEKGRFSVLVAFASGEVFAV